MVNPADPDFDIGSLTIRYFSRPHTIPSAAERPVVSEEDLTFYRRRILSTTRGIAKGTVSNSEVEAAYRSYASCLIRNFKTADRSSLIQEEFKALERKAPRPEELPNTAPDTLMMRTIEDTTLGGYVQRRKMKPKERKVPLIKTFNLRKKEFRKSVATPSGIA